MRMTTQLIHFTQWARILTIVDDSSWEPDGVTLQVRFCEGCETYWFAGILAATLPIMTEPSFWSIGV
jgi:hypothetical protein